MNVHGSAARMRNTSAPVSQFQFQTTLREVAAAKTIYTTIRWWVKKPPKVPLRELKFGIAVFGFRIIGISFPVAMKGLRKLVIRDPSGLQAAPVDINLRCSRGDNGVPDALMQISTTLRAALIDPRRIDAAGTGGALWR
jgi:hypothetical protein